MTFPNKEKLKSFVGVLPHLYFVFYFLLCIIYYKERLIYTDNSYFLFRIVNDESFAIFHLRWVGILTQWIPLLMVKLSIPLKYVAIGFSLNLALVYYITYLVFRYYFRQPIYALIVIVLTSLLQYYAFYWQVSELNSTMPIFLIIVWFIFYKAIKYNIYLAILGTFSLCLCIIFIHPLLSILLIQILLGLCIYSKNKKLLISVGIAILALLIKYKLLSGFESSKILDFNPELFKWSVIKSSYLYYAFKMFLSKQFYIATCIVLLFGLYLLFRKRFLLLAYYIISSVALYLLIYYYLPYGEIVAYMESYFILMYIPLLINLFLILQNDFLQYKNWIIIVFVLLGTKGLYNLNKERLFQDRLKYIAEITNHANDLGYIEKDKMNLAIVMTAWAMPFETLLLSTIQGHSKSVYYNEEDIDFMNEKDDHLFVSPDWVSTKRLEDLNPKYFKIQSQLYQKIELPQVMR